MSALDALLHLLNFLLPAALLGAIAAGLAKLVWRRSLKAVGWGALAAWSGGAALIAAGVAVATTGRDGTIMGYAAMVAASAAGLGWAGWMRR